MRSDNSAKKVRHNDRMPCGWNAQRTKEAENRKKIRLNSSLFSKFLISRIANIYSELLIGDAEQFMKTPNNNTPTMDRIQARYAQSASKAAAVLFQAKWRVEILCAMRLGPVRVGQLSRLIPGASKKMLAQNLRRLEADGIVVRLDKSDMVLHVEYELHREAREEVCSLLDHLANWGRIYAGGRATSPTGDEHLSK